MEISLENLYVDTGVKGLRESKMVLDSTLWILDSGFWIPLLVQF